MSELAVPTPHGPGRAVLELPGEPRATLLLGHGAGGSITAPDLTAARRAGLAAGLAVALFEQPYRVAGRRAPAPTRQLDAAWLAAVEALTTGPLAGLALVAGGRSSGARVACRTARQAAAVGVLCLAFPLRPPARTGRPAAPDRASELDGAGVPVLVVQGSSDPFGMPAPAAGREIAEVAGDHRLGRASDAVAAATGAWLERLLA